MPLLAFLLLLAAPGQDTSLTVMSFNIRYGTASDGDDAWPHRRALLIETIAGRQPDVLGLQEALRFQLDELASALPGYGEIGVGREDGVTAGEYAAILYRRERVTPETTGTFWLSATPEIPGSTTWGNRITRICTWAVFVDGQTGRRFAVANVHLDHESQPSREQAVALVLARLDALAPGLPVVLLGDFNAGEDNPAVAAVRAAGFTDTYRAVRPEDRFAGTFGAFRGDSTGAKIDYVFVRGPWVVEAADILRRRSGTRDPSDHFPVVARLTVER